MSKYVKRGLLGIGLLMVGYFAYNSFIIYRYSSEYSEVTSDVAIVLGAATNDEQVSPVFRERINHALYLYEQGLVKKLIFTGGYGKWQSKSDSRIAKEYAVKNGVPSSAILIEESSRYTVQNLLESKRIMDSLDYRTALIVSDPLHMKRSIRLAEKLGIDCKPSPTKTSMYRSTLPKTKSLFYETLFYSVGHLKEIGKD